MGRGQPKKVERLRGILSDQGAFGELASFFTSSSAYRSHFHSDWNPSGAEHGFQVRSESAETAFCTPSDEVVNMIFKKGDDLRQDQLCVQMISSWIGC